MFTNSNRSTRYATAKWMPFALAAALFVSPGDSASAKTRKRLRPTRKRAAARKTAAPRRKRLFRRPARPTLPGNKLAAKPKLINGKAHGSLKGVDQLVQDFLKQYKIPGVTVAVTKGGRLVLSKGYGYANAGKKIAMQPYHRTKIGSVSKLLTTAAVMKLHEQSNGFTVERKMYGPTGLFKGPAFNKAMNDAIARYQPQENWKSWYCSTQIKHLLSHSAGWERSGDKEGTAKMFNVPVDQVTPRQVHLHFLSTKKLLFAPGSQSKYSNRGMGVMAHVVKRVSGKSYKWFVKKHVLHPIGLYDVASVSDPVSALDASPHKYANDGNSFVPFELSAKPGQGAAGGWRASARDLARFLVATDQLSNHSDILKKKTLQLMETRPFPNTVPGKALGWGIRVKGTGKKLSHNGLLNAGTAYMVKYTPGYIANDGTDLSNINVAICANIRNGSATGGMNSLAGKIAKAAGKAKISPVYDLFKSPQFKLAK